MLSPTGDSALRKEVQERRKSKLRRARRLPPPRFRLQQRNFGAGAEWLQFWGTVKIEFRRLVKTTSFIVITAFALLNCVPALILSNTEGFGNTFLPVTYRLLEVIAGTLYLFLIAMITYFAGVLAWEERDSGTDEVHDALPNPEWPTYLAKLTALMSSIVIILAVAMCAALLVQFFHGYHRYQIGLYLANLFGIDLLGFVFPGGSRVFHSCHLAQQVRRLLRIYRFPHPDHVHLVAVAYRHLSGPVRPGPDNDVFGFLRVRAVPRELDLVHAVLDGILRFSGGGHRPAVAAWTRHQLAQPHSKCASALSRGRALCSGRGSHWFPGHRMLDFLQHQGPEYGAQRKRR